MTDLDDARRSHRARAPQDRQDENRTEFLTSWVTTRSLAHRRRRPRHGVRSRADRPGRITASANRLVKKARKSIRTSSQSWNVRSERLSVRSGQVTFHDHEPSSPTTRMDVPPGASSDTRRFSDQSAGLDNSALSCSHSSIVCCTALMVISRTGRLDEWQLVCRSKTASFGKLV